MAETEARALADAILQVSATQPPAEAMKLVEMALARASEQPIVLNAAGGHLLRVGDAPRARAIYEKAVTLDAKAKVLWLNLAQACRALGDLDAEEKALIEALAIDPRYVLALLQRAELMERRRDPYGAFFLYEAALDSAASAPPPRQAATALAHAQAVVQANRQALEKYLEQEVASLRQQHAAADQHRFDVCRDLYLRKRRVYHSQPKEILFPFLQEFEYFPDELFPWLKLLEASTEDIAAEAVSVLGSDQAGFRPYVDFPSDTPVDQWASLNHSLDWSVYSLWHDGERIEDHIALCPKTAAVLAQLTMCDIPKYAPGAFFSVLKPHTHLPAHTGTTNTRAIVHLPLVIPAGCRFRVGGDTRTWEKGKAWVFDDSIEHEAWNDSDQTRIILIFDIWNPLLSAAERDLVRQLTTSIGRFYGLDAPTLGSR